MAVYARLCTNVFPRELLHYRLIAGENGWVRREAVH